MNILARHLTHALFALLLAGVTTGASAQGSNRVRVLKIVDSINVGVSEKIARAVQDAETRGDSAVIIELDTPGGFLEATRDIVQVLLNSEKTKVIVWVTPVGARAASAGSMITMAAHFAAMSPSTSIGAATPVDGSGKDIPESMKAKITNDTLAFVEGIAQKRGRNIEWAKKSVSEAASLSASEAAKLKVIDGVYENRAELWRAARAKFPELAESPVFEDFEPSWRERILSFVSNPNIAYGMLALGAMLIYVEITNPGIVIPGSIGAVCLVLGAMTMKIIPIEPGAIALLVVALILFGIEVLTPIPTYGVAGVMAAVSLLLSGVFLLDQTQTTLHLDPWIWLPTFFLVLGFMAYLTYGSVRSLKSRGYPQGDQALDQAIGEVTRVLSPTKAKIRVHGELWDAVPESGELDWSQGSKVRVVRTEGLKAVVRMEPKNN